jgi:hypothetical protein
VLLFGKELASLAPLDEVFGTTHGRGPVEARSVRSGDQIGGCCVAATLTTMDLNQELKAFCSQDALHQHTNADCFSV